MFYKTSFFVILSEAATGGGVEGSFILSLRLLVFGISLADYPHLAAPANDLALLTNFLD
jgi:hypothetical protein